MNLPGTITTNAATIRLGGATSQLLNTSTGTDALAGFTTNAAAGSFTIQNGRNFTPTGSFTNAGALKVGTGSTFTIPSGTSLTLNRGSAYNVNGATDHTGGTLNIHSGATAGTGGAYSSGRVVS